MRFLIAESDKLYAAQLTEMIKSCGQHDTVIDHVSSVPDALILLQTHAYDLCFLDYHLDGDKTGLDVLKALRHTSLMTAFVFLTAHACKDAAFEALNLGAMDYLIKNRFTQFELAKCMAYSLFLKSREIILQKEALHDSLTGLGNKGLFDAQLHQAAERAKRDGEKLGVLVIDVNGFKAINDKYGHKVGDQLLQQIAERIVNETRSSDVVARIGGDEFAAILIKPKSADHIYAVAQKIEETLGAAPYSISGHTLKVSSSVGSAVLPDDDEDLDALFTAADKRMYARKETIKAGHRVKDGYVGLALH